MAKEKLEIWITLKDRLTKGMNLAGRALGSMRKSVDRLKNAVFSLRSAMVAATTFFVGQKLIGYANEQAKSVAGMETALRSMGNYSPELSRELQRIASNIQGLTNYGDEAVLMGQKFLLTYRDIGLDMMPRVSMAMADLAELMGGDMRQAANMLGKASMGMTGELRRVGITVDANVYKMEGFLGVLKAIESQSKGQATAARKATGAMIAMSNSFLDVKEKAGDFIKIMLEPAFLTLLERFNKLNELIEKLKKEGQLDKWADKVIDKVEVLALGFEAFYNAVSPIIGKVKDLFVEMWDWFQGLPGTVQTYGLIGVVMLGKKKMAIVAILVAIKELEAVLDNWKKTVAEVTKEEVSGLRVRLGYYERLLVWQKENGKATGDTITKIRELETALRAITGVKIESVLGELVPEELEGVAKFFEKYRKKLEEIRKEQAVAPKAPKGAAPEKTVDLSRQVKENMLALEVFYKEGKIKLLDYLDFRKKYILKALNIEINKIQDEIQAEANKIKRLKEALSEEADVDKKAILEKSLAYAEQDTAKREELASQLFVKKQEYALKEMELESTIAQEYEKNALKKIEIDDILKDLKERAALNVSTDLEALHAQELAELDRRQQEEMQRIMDLTEFMENEGEKRAKIDQVLRDQTIEKDKVLAHQQRQLMMQRLDNAEKIAGGLADIFQDLYELGGKESKKMFELQKKAAIAEAIISTAKAVAGALGTPPYGLAAIANATIIALKGGLQIAKIKAQEMAEGGLVEGYSPHSKADDVGIKATAGEFMQPVSAVKYYGKKVMEGIRKNIFPKEIFEGFQLPAFAVRSNSGSGYADGGQVTGGNSNFSVSVPININDSGATGIAGMLQDEVEETVIRVMERELR